MGAMTVLLAEALPSFHFEGDDLVSFHLIYDLGFDNGFNILANGQFVVAMREEYFTELDFVTGIARDTGDEQSLIFLDFELLAGYFHDC